MRKVARIAFEKRGSAQEITELWSKSQAAIAKWIESKGSVSIEDGAQYVVYRNGRRAVLETTELSIDHGGLKEWRLAEPADHNTTFVTNLALGRRSGLLAFTCKLEVGQTESVIAPLYFDAHCPRIVRDLIELDSGWRVGTRDLSIVPLVASTDAQGAALSNDIWDPNRRLPLVVVSVWQGRMLHESISRGLARDLAGLAVVLEITTGVAWELTNRMSQDWSCFNQAIRVYWPGATANDTPLNHHPLWTRERLLDQYQDPRVAAEKLRAQLRRRILALSAFAVRPPPVLADIRSEASRKARAARVAAAQSNNDFRDLADSYSQENDKLRKDYDALRDQCDDLEAQLANLQASLRCEQQQTCADEIAPDELPPPATVSEAVARAREAHNEDLFFGDSVPDGVALLAEDAGPPDKILRYLDTLAELAQALRTGSLGVTKIKWLEDRSVTASGESETVKNSSADMTKRTWYDGVGQRRFHLHMKPAEATSPDRCVRIYFDWDRERSVMIVGRVGRHP